MDTIVDLVDRVLSNPENEEVISKVRGEVNALMQGRALFNA